MSIFSCEKQLLKRKASNNFRRSKILEKYRKKDIRRRKFIENFQKRLVKYPFNLR